MVVICVAAKTNYVTRRHFKDGKEHSMTKQSTQTVLKPEPLPPSSPISYEEPASASLDERAVAVLAYQFWEERGRPEGSPEEDWYRAERELQLRSLVP
jgi:hypothetical protein